MDVTVKLPVCYEYTFPTSITVANTRLVSALLGSIVIGTCVYLDFFAWFKCPCNVSTDFGKYLHTSFDVNTGHDWKKHCILPIYM